MAAKSSSMFDAIAKPKAEAKAKSSKIAATVTDAIKSAVDGFIRIKAQLAALEAEKVDYATAIIDHVRPQQDRLAYTGQYSKSFSVAGTTGEVLYTATDRFSVPKGEAEQEALAACVGNKFFEEHYETRRQVVVKPSATENKELMAKWRKAIEAAGLDFGDVFEVTDTLVAKPDLDVAQYELKPDKLAEFRTLCKQYTPGVK